MPARRSPALPLLLAYAPGALALPAFLCVYVMTVTPHSWKVNSLTCDQLHITQLPTPGFTPHALDLLERSHDSVMHCIRTIIGHAAQKKWVLAIFANICVNSAVNRGTGFKFSPLKAATGRDPYLASATPTSCHPMNRTSHVQ